MILSVYSSELRRGVNEAFDALNADKSDSKFFSTFISSNKEATFGTKITRLTYGPRGSFGYPARSGAKNQCQPRRSQLVNNNIQITIPVLAFEVLETKLV